MKNLIAFLISCISLSALLAQTSSQTEVNVLSDTYNEIVVEVTVRGFLQSTVQTPDGAAITLQVDGGTPLLVKGAPDLPKIAHLLHIPATGNMAVEVLESTYVDFNNVRVAPSKGNLKRTIDPNTLPYVKGAAYQQDAFYPGALAELKTPFIQRDVRGQALWLQPLQYNPQQQTLRVYDHFTLRIYATGGQGENEITADLPHLNGQVFDDVFQKSYLNYRASAASKGAEEPEKMLVIAPDAYEAGLEPLLAWKRQLGIHTTFVPLSQIGSSDADQVSRFVADYYAQHGIQYLLLVGDNEAIEPQMRESGGTLYACDNCFGYITGNDHLQEIFTGRLHAANTAQLAIMVNRILAYEQQPLVDSMANWCATGLASCSNEGQGIGDDGQADYEHSNEWKAKHLTDGFEEYWEFYDGNHSNISPTPGHPSADADGDPTNTPIVELMNTRGACLYNYTGHGWEQGLASGNFNTDAVSNMRNAGRFPILIAVACCTGDFTDNGAGDCLGEAWQRAGDTTTGEPWGGIAGFFSSDFQSWAPPMEGQDGMNQYLVDADGINLSPSIGGMALYGNTLMIAAYQADGEAMADFWNPFADPTTVPRTRLPQSMTATHLPALNVGSTNIVVNCPVEGARVGLYWKGQTLAAGRISNGYADLTFTPLDDIGEITVTVSQFNYIPYQGNVLVSPASGPFVVRKDFRIDDSAANNNQQAEFGETFKLDLDIANVGFSTATATRIALSTNSTWVGITDATEDLGDLLPDSTMLVKGAFEILVADNVPNGTVAELILTTTFSDTFTLTSTISLTLLAPAFVITSYEIRDDAPGGNNNGRLENDEQATLLVRTQNIGGAESPLAMGLLADNSPWIASGPAIDLGTFAPGAEKEVEFPIAVASDAPVYAEVAFTYSTVAAAYGVSETLTPVLINPIVEDFETANFTYFPWVMGGEKPWVITTADVYLGTYGAHSGTIADAETSTMQLTLDVSESGNVGFSRRVSSEKDWDFLRFFIDGVQQDFWSGDQPWESVSYPVSTGIHTFTWTYEKDQFYTDGLDRAWVDDIYLPPYKIIVDAPTLSDHTLALSLNPNPTTGLLWLDWDAQLQGDLHIVVFDATGRVVREVQGQHVGGRGRSSVDLRGEPKGLYFVRFVLGDQSVVKKLVIGG